MGSLWFFLFFLSFYSLICWLLPSPNPPRQDKNVEPQVSAIVQDHTHKISHWYSSSSSSCCTFPIKIFLFSWIEFPFFLKFDRISWEPSCCLEIPWSASPARDCVPRGESCDWWNDLQSEGDSVSGVGDCRHRGGPISCQEWTKEACFHCLTTGNTRTVTSLWWCGEWGEQGNARGSCWWKIVIIGEKKRKKEIEAHILELLSRCLSLAGSLLLLRVDGLTAKFFAFSFLSFSFLFFFFFFFSFSFSPRKKKSPSLLLVFFHLGASYSRILSNKPWTDYTHTTIILVLRISLSLSWLFKGKRSHHRISLWFVDSVGQSLF